MLPQLLSDHIPVTGTTLSTGYIKGAERTPHLNNPVQLDGLETVPSGYSTVIYHVRSIILVKVSSVLVVKYV
ncbi:hypothetical protein ACKKBG_A16195 [Auxenochlorella protothecoides x Auxenochlorella symbiontica]